MHVNRARRCSLVARMGSLLFVGHATVHVELDGTRVLTDPLLRRRVAHLWRAAAVNLTDLDRLKDVDAALVSHVHYDHLDMASLRLLRKGTTIVAPHGTRRLLRRFEDAHQLKADDELQVGSLLVRATRAEHHGLRPTVRSATSLGYLLLGSQRVYFAGDTDLFSGMSDFADSLDVALLPVAGWGPRLPAGHLSPERAAKALRLLRPRIAVPIHWGTFAPFGRRPHTTAPEEFRRHAAELAPEVEIRILQPGSSTSF